MENPSPTPPAFKVVLLPTEAGAERLFEGSVDPQSGSHTINNLGNYAI